MSENKKTSLERAILEAREIEKAAMEGAKKVLEESVYPKIEEAVKETVRELEEGVTIDVGSADVNINVEDGVTSVEIDAEEEDLDIQSDGLDSDDEIDADDFSSDADDSDDSEEENGDDLDSDDFSSDEEDEEDEDIFEVEGLEDEVPAEAPAEEMVAEVPAEEAPAEEAPVEDSMDVDMGGGEEGFPGLEDLSSKLDAILSKLDGAEDTAAEVNVEAPVGEEAPEAIGAEGEVEVVDDETAPIEDEVVAEDEEEFIEFNFDDDNEDGGLEEIEIIDNEEEELEEMHGVGQVFDHGNTLGKLPNDTEYRINENKTQEEAKAVELEKENESLRESLKEYKESFKILRKQINEVQTFNAKLAYVNKLFSKGGLTNGEKIQIAEDFDKVATVEEAKTLYNKVINENKKVGTDVKTEQLKSKLKSTSPAIEPSTKSETLYESKEMNRMQKLAGIRKPLND